MISTFLSLNQNKDKQQVAMKKILHHYKDFDMEPLFGLDLKMLPVILAWLESVCVDDDDEVNGGDKGKNAFWVMPMMVVPYNHSAWKACWVGKQKI